MAGKEYPLMAEPLITDEMENWEPGPRCQGCGSPGSFQAGQLCWGCMNRHLDARGALERIDAARELVMTILTADHVPDETMRRLVRARDYLDQARQYAARGISP